MFLTIGKVRIFTLILMAFPAWASTNWEALHDTPVYQAPTQDAHVLFYLHRGEHAAVSADGEFYKARVVRKGKAFNGFISKYDVEEAPKVVDHDWGWSLGAELTSLNQAGKTFQTSDQVNWTTGAYNSTSVGPALAVQFGDRDFWRLTVSEKQTKFDSTASEDHIIGSQTQSVTLQQTFVSGLLQKAWSWQPFYMGLGVEAAKAMAVRIAVGGATEPITSSDLVFWLGGEGFAGFQYFFNPSWSLFSEVRCEYIANQTPAIYMIQGAVSVVYWP